MTKSTVSNPLEMLTLPELRERTSMKWRTHPRDVLPLWVAEMDVPLAAPVVDALHRALDAGDTGYATGEDYAVALADFASTRWAWQGFPAESAMVMPDVMMGIVEVLRVVSQPGDPVVVNSPVYAPFYAFVNHSGRRTIEAPLTSSGRLDLDVLESSFRHARAVSPRPVYLLCSPHNPTGVVHTRAELASVADLATQHGVRVIADEIHAPLVLDGARFTPYLSLPGTDDALSLMSASKAWNLAGLKAALLTAGPAAARADLVRIPEEVSHGPSHLGVIAHSAAFRHGGPWLDALLSGLNANRELLGELLAEQLPEVGYLRPEGTYLAWLDCRPLGIDTPAGGATGVVSELAGPARYFLDHARVALSSGHVFGTGGSGHVRLNFATGTAILTEAITRIGTAADAVRAAAAR